MFGSKALQQQKGNDKNVDPLQEYTLEQANRYGFDIPNLENSVTQNETSEYETNHLIEDDKKLINDNMDSIDEFESNKNDSSSQWPPTRQSSLPKETTSTTPEMFLDESGTDEFKNKLRRRRLHRATTTTALITDLSSSNHTNKNSCSTSLISPISSSSSSSQSTLSLASSLNSKYQISPLTPLSPLSSTAVLEATNNSVSVTSQSIYPSPVFSPPLSSSRPDSMLHSTTASSTSLNPISINSCESSETRPLPKKYCSFDQYTNSAIPINDSQLTIETSPAPFIPTKSPARCNTLVRFNNSVMNNVSHSTPIVSYPSSIQQQKIRRVNTMTPTTSSTLTQRNLSTSISSTSSSLSDNINDDSISTSDFIMPSQSTESISKSSEINLQIVTNIPNTLQSAPLNTPPSPPIPDVIIKSLRISNVVIQNCEYVFLIDITATLNLPLPQTRRTQLREEFGFSGPSSILDSKIEIQRARNLQSFERLNCYLLRHHAQMNDIILDNNILYHGSFISPGRRKEHNIETKWPPIYPQYIKNNMVPTSGLLLDLENWLGSWVNGLSAVSLWGDRVFLNFLGLDSVENLSTPPIINGKATTIPSSYNPHYNNYVIPSSKLNLSQNNISNSLTKTDSDNFNKLVRRTTIRQPISGRRGSLNFTDNLEKSFSISGNGAYDNLRLNLEEHRRSTVDTKIDLERNLDYNITNDR